jgi:TRAP-type mannitol/chloroaromatic compound transport system substrate-binding protein
MNRRKLLIGATGTGVATAAFPMPAIAQGVRELKMVTSWPKGSPGLGTSADRFGSAITAITGGRLKVQVFGAGQLVRAFQVFDAVSSGVADMYHSFEGYFEQKSRGLPFFSASPFGFTADELFAWVHYGGGQELWDALSGQFNIKPLLCTSSGCQMGGWFVHEVSSPESYKGLRYRMGTPSGAEVLRRMGAVVVNLPGGEIMSALQSGAIDASEWIGPWLDMAIGLHKAAAFYYYPAFHEPGSGFSLGINRAIWESFNTSDQRAFETVAACEYARSLAEFNANNAFWLRKLRDESTVKILRFDDSLLNVMLAISKDVVAEMGSRDDLSRKIYASYEQFRASIIDWTDISERAYLNSRGLA